MDLVDPMTQQLAISRKMGCKQELPETRWCQQLGEGTDLSFVALQPIFDHNRRIVAFEALSRSGRGNQFEGSSDGATRQMVDDCVSHGLSGLTGGLPIFLNCTRESMLSGILLRLPRSTVLELLETIVPDSEVLHACRQLKKLGFRIALDDFRPSEEMREIVDLADFIKVDFRLSDKSERKKIRRLLKRTNATLIAEKIETLEEFQAAHNETFTLYQGYFLAPPMVFCRPNARIAA